MKSTNACACCAWTSSTVQYRFARHSLNTCNLGTADINTLTQFLPGQWLDTFVPSVPKAGGFTITSPPSLASSSNPRPYLELAVQESPSNSPAAWLWKRREDILGQILKVRIGGSFTFPPSEDWKGKRVVFVAGGVGINPLMSMLSHISESETGLDVRVAYGTKVTGNGLVDVVFAERIKDLYKEGRLKGVFRLLATGRSTTSSKKETLSEKAEFEVLPRRISVQDVEDLVGTADEYGTTAVYVCGPPTMTDEFVAALTSKEEGLGLHQSQVLTEKWW